jgi:putative Mn2+ efflux pump MntP
MDAFSLALIYGTYGLTRREEILLAVIVGIFHFGMPLLGVTFGSIIMKYFIFNVHLVVGIIFGIIGIEMILSSNREEDVKIMVSLVGFLLFGLSVSIDSLTTGIGLSAISHHYVGISFMFMIVSGSFTYIGLRMGNKLSERFGKYATISGGIIMILLAIHYIL